MRSTRFPPIRVEPQVLAEVEAVLQEGETPTQFIEEAIVAAAWRRSEAAFVTRGQAAIDRWKSEGGGQPVAQVLTRLQAKLDAAKRQAAAPVRNRHRPSR